MMNRKLLLLALFSFVLISQAQVTFSNSNSSLVNASLTSGVAIGVSDMNGDGLDDIIRLNDAINLEIEYQTASGTFTRYDYGSTGGIQWGLAIADVDENGYNDIFIGGSYNGRQLLQANNSGTTLSQTLLGGQNIFVQNVNFADIDNDGMIDLFVCHDDGISSPYRNSGPGTLTFDANLIETPSTIPSDNSGNYGTIWIDYDNDNDLDLYISKCRLSASGDPMDGRRVNLLFQNDGSGNYTDVALDAGLRPYGQSWSSSFEDIDNDGDLDVVVINHDITSVIYENNGNGTFTDITASTGIATDLANIDLGIQVLMEDFDNDTFVDIFITDGAGTGDHAIYKNNGDKTFTKMPTPFPTGGNTIQSAANGDLNNDGFMDVIAGFANGFNGSSTNPDILYLNNGNSNNWTEILLEGVESNINGIGARVELHYDTNKMQIREVRSGESYGTMNSLMTHFGLGTNTAIDKIVVKWPSGIVDELINPTINTAHSLLEGSTLSTPDFANTSFNVYPNPITNDVTISGPVVSKISSIEVFDLTGKYVISKAFFLEDISVKVDMSSLNSGLYFIHITADDQKYVHKIIKE